MTVKSWNKKLKAISQETSQTSSVHVVGQIPGISFDKVSLPVLKKFVKDHYIDTLINSFKNDSFSHG